MYQNKHYITVAADGRILTGWSDGPHPDRDTTGAVLLREGGYQFRLFSGGEENPRLTDEIGAHLYRYEGETVRESTAEEIAAERAEIIAALPPESPSLEARVSEVETGKADKEEVEAVWNQMAAAYAEGVNLA